MITVEVRYLHFGDVVKKKKAALSSDVYEAISLLGMYAVFI